MEYVQTKIYLRKWNAWNSLGFWDTNGSPNTSQKTKPSVNLHKRERTCLVDFAIPADHKSKIKESEKINKYFDFTRELKKTKKTKKNYGTWGWQWYQL